MAIKNKAKIHKKIVVVIINPGEGTTDIKNYKVMKGTKQYNDLLKKYWDENTAKEEVCCTRKEKNRIIHTTILG